MERCTVICLKSSFRSSWASSERFVFVQRDRMAASLISYSCVAWSLEWYSFRTVPTRFLTIMVLCQGFMSLLEKWIAIKIWSLILKRIETRAQFLGVHSVVSSNTGNSGTIHPTNPYTRNKHYFSCCRLHMSNISVTCRLERQSRLIHENFIHYLGYYYYLFYVSWKKLREITKVPIFYIIIWVTLSIPTGQVHWGVE